MSNISKRGASIVIFSIIALAPLALADVSDNLFELVICRNGVCVADYYVPSQGTWNPATQQWEWILDQDVVFDDPQNPGSEFATLNSGTAIAVQPPIPGLRTNPQVLLNFVMTGGTEDTEFTITSALQTFDPMVNPFGQSEVGINLTDRNGNGATLWSTLGNDGVSFSHYNGLAPAGSLFAELLRDDILANPFQSAAGSDNTNGFQPIVDIVSSMSARINFMVSARDLASGSSTFIIIPEPASLALLLSLALLRRR